MDRGIVQCGRIKLSKLLIIDLSRPQQGRWNRYALCVPDIEQK